jgi:type IV pilus assembly protein PilO
MLKLNHLVKGSLCMKGSIALCFGILSFYCSHRLFINDAQRQLAGLHLDAAKLQQNYASKQQQASQLPIYKRQLESLKQQLLPMLSQLSAKDEIPSLLEAIAGSGRDHGLSFILFSPEAERVQDFYMELPVKIIVQGSYFQLLAFLQDLASIKRIVTLHELSVERISTRREAGILSIQVVAKIYRYIA